jgi:hypothetical protein
VGKSLPDPTPEGDSCRRFKPDDVDRLMAIVNDLRVGVWIQVTTTGAAS